MRATIFYSILFCFNALLLSVVTSKAETRVDARIQPSKPEAATQVAFAGGGWRAHAAHSAWVLSLLQRHNSLTKVFTNVDVISSNSGGSWFNAMMSYSPEFVAAIEAKDAFSQWSISKPDATGWLGQQHYLFTAAQCGKHAGELFFPCVAKYYTGGLLKTLYWHKLVEKLVFKDNPISQALSGERQPWADDKALLLAASLITNNAVLGQYEIDKQYYQACVPPLKVKLAKHRGSYCVDQRKKRVNTADVTPVTFASLPTSSHWQSPPFLSVTRSSKVDHLELGYTENAYFWPAKAKAKISNPASTDNVPVIVAASASSAAVGFAVSESVTGSWEESYLVSDEALNMTLSGGLKHQLTDGMSVAQLQQLQAIQVADGGAVDNSAVAQLVSFLQHNQQADGFNIVAFDNVQQLFAPDGSGAPVGVDIANLFGQGLSNGNQICSGKNCVKVPDLQVFELASLQTTRSVWQAKASTHEPPKVLNQLIYTPYKVTTVENPELGITAGSVGTLHAFTAVWSNANTAPESLGDFDIYTDMLSFINSALSRSNAAGKSGMEYLEAALRLQ